MILDDLDDSGVAVAGAVLDSAAPDGPDSRDPSASSASSTARPEVELAREGRKTTVETQIQAWLNRIIVDHT